jgi:cleavage stimulation factor subunit 1
MWPLSFHPTGDFLIIGTDHTVKLCDISKPSVKKTHTKFAGVHAVWPMSFHLTGDFLIVGTDHTVKSKIIVEQLGCQTVIFKENINK